MILDQTGTLANVKRHDYMPFGEEIFAPTGGRTAGQGYAGGDDVQQQFTQKERDNETGMDYFLARFYASPQGRFVSPDTFSAIITNPQTVNRYAYVGNNPLKYIDPPKSASHGTINVADTWTKRRTRMGPRIGAYRHRRNQATLFELHRFV